MYGVKVAPTFTNPLLVLAAAIATDRYTSNRWRWRKLQLMMYNMRRSLSVAAKRAPTFDSPGIDTSSTDFPSSASAGGGGD
jgi:hypothetical protein